MLEGQATSPQLTVLSAMLGEIRTWDIRQELDPSWTQADAGLGLSLVMADKQMEEDSEQ